MSLLGKAEQCLKKRKKSWVPSYGYYSSLFPGSFWEMALVFVNFSDYLITSIPQSLLLAWSLLGSLDSGSRFPQQIQLNGHGYPKYSMSPSLNMLHLFSTSFPFGRPLCMHLLPPKTSNWDVIKISPFSQYLVNATCQ